MSFHEKDALDAIRHSPNLPEIVGLLQTALAEEQERRKRFYEEMTPEQKVEFIDGEVVMHSPARNRHLDATKFIFKLVDTFVEIHSLGTVKSEKCLVVFPRNDYEPDIVFFRKEKEATLGNNTMKFPVPDFVVEVLSESTENRDRGVKFQDYALNGVEEYWIVDSEKEIVEQYLLNDSGEYELALKSSSGVVKSRVITGFKSEIEAFFDRTKNLAALRETVANS